MSDAPKPGRRFVVGGTPSEPAAPPAAAAAPTGASTRGRDIGIAAAIAVAGLALAYLTRDLAVADVFFFGGIALALAWYFWLRHRVGRSSR